MIRLVEAGNAEVSTEKFVAAWMTLVIQHGDRKRPVTQPIEIRAEAASFDQQIANGRGGTLDVLCRCLAPSAPSDTMMATRRMQELNEQFILVDRSVEPYTAQLTERAWNTWHSIAREKQNELLREALSIVRPSLR